MKGTSKMSQSPSKGTILTDKAYNVLKHVAAVGLPAVSTLYFALAQIWHFPDTDEVMATISAVNVFLGAVVGVSSFQYKNSDSKYAGEVQITETPEKKIYAISVNGQPEDLDQMSEATFKIVPLSSTPAVPPSA